MRVRAKIAALIAAAVAAVGAADGPTWQIEAWGDNSLRVRVAPPGGAIVDPAFMGLLPDPPALSVRTDVRSPTSVTCGNLQGEVDSTTGLLTLTRVSDGAVLLQQSSLTFGQAAVGSAAGAVSAEIAFEGHGAGERIYGLGEHRSGVVQALPFFKNIQQSQDYQISHGGDVTIPWYASSLGYGFLWNLPSYGLVNLTAESLSWYSNATQLVDFWVTTTPAPASASTVNTPAPDPALSSPFAALMAQYTAAVGRAPLMPYYSTGFIQCKDRYRNQTQLLEVATGYVSRGLPISTIVIDWKHWVNQGDWSFDPQCWPDPQGMFNELAGMGIELMTTFWPQQTPQSQHWAEFSGGNLLATNLSGSQVPFDGNGVYLVDQTNPAARNATFAGFWEGYGNLGIRSIWLDAAEPERQGEESFGQVRFAAGTDTEVGEAWVQQHARSFAEGFASQGIGLSEFFTLPRHAWTGSWRYGAALWSGDIQSTFAELSLQIRVLQGVMMSGVALWTTDIGGYWGGDVTQPEFRDLIVRWFQFGAFSPLFRLHGHRAGGPPENECGPTNGDNEVWDLAPEQDHYDAIVSVMHLRENLRDYVYHLSNETAHTGIPIVRPMFLQWPADAGCQGQDVEDQFMFGPDWLVAPVYEYNTSTRSVYLPSLAGSNYTWIYWWNQSSVGAGGARVDMDVTAIGEFPLFFRQPVTPPAPVTPANATSLWSAERQEQVLCLSSQCFGANVPSNNGSYVPQFGSGVADCAGLASLPDGGEVEIDGISYPVVQLMLHFSFKYGDNYVTTATTMPDPSYEDVVMPNGYVLSAPAPGTLPLQVFFRQYSASHQDYYTTGSSEGAAWAQNNSYTLVGTVGYVFPA